MIIPMIFVIICVIISAVIIFAPPMKKRKPHEIPWSSGKDLSELLMDRPDSKLSELERWWKANKSKDAAISRLESQVRILMKTLENAKKQPALSTFPQSAIENWGKDHSKVMVLPKDVSYYRFPEPTIAGIRIEGPLADMIMTPDNNKSIQLTIRNGRVVNWSAEWGDEWY